MSQIEWYYARDNKQQGPVSSVELKRLAASGALKPDDLVWREGMTEWAAARNVRGLFEEQGGAGGGTSAIHAPQAVAEAGATAPSEPTAAMATAPSPVASSAAPARHLFDALFDQFRPVFGPKFIETTARVFRLCGSWGLFAAAALAGAFAIVRATKGDVAVPLLEGFLWIVILLTLQYVSGKFCDGVERLNRETCGTLASAALPDCFAVLFKLAGAAILIRCVVAAIEGGEYSGVLLGAASFLAFIYLTAVAMNPAALNITIASESDAEKLPGGEAIGVVLFLAKALLRLVPVAFGVGVVCGALLLAAACYQAHVGEPTADREARRLLFQAGILPLTAYLAFLVVNLLVNLWRSLLSLPGKLDKLAEREQRD